MPANALHRAMLARPFAGGRRANAAAPSRRTLATLSSEAATVVLEPAGATHIIETILSRVWRNAPNSIRRKRCKRSFTRRRERRHHAQSPRASLHRFESHGRVHARAIRTGRNPRPPVRRGDMWSTRFTRVGIAVRPSTMADHARHAAAEHVGGMTKRKPGSGRPSAGRGRPGDFDADRPDRPRKRGPRSTPRDFGRVRPARSSRVKAVALPFAWAMGPTSCWVVTRSSPCLPDSATVCTAWDSRALGHSSSHQPSR